VKKKTNDPRKPREAGRKAAPPRKAPPSRKGREKAWSGRFREGTAREVELFTESIGVDRRLYRQDIQGSIAHVRMLGRQGILTGKEAGRIEAGLRQIAGEIREGRLVFSPALEDIHMHIEARLAEIVGETGGKLHTARSRNDQVALDTRLYLREEVDRIREGILRLLELLTDQAEAHLELILPGYTHLQKAQPVRLAHHLLAYGQMFLRDEQRLCDLRERVDVMPLGAGALAGTGYPVDPACVAGILGFSRTASNSMDAVSDRDFVIEFCFVASMILLHLSRWSEELILWSAEAFGFVELPDAYCTGSSMMPQKKNPDVLELIRGKTGGVFGDLQALLVLMKGLPLTYNRDMQEDKGPLFHAVDTVRSCVSVFTSLLGAIRFDGERMRAEAEQGFLNATDLADFLARRGMPFRRAHRVAGEAVRACLERGKRLEEMTAEEWQAVSPDVDPSVQAALELEAVVEARSSSGGTARKQVLRQIRVCRKEIGKRKEDLRRDLARVAAAWAETGLPA
jgi:argininosuccinate lyase